MTTPDPSATSHVAAVARVKALLPIARTMGPLECELAADRCADLGHTDDARLWRAAARIVSHELFDTPR